jgi:HSP20 family protein
MSLELAEPPFNHLARQLNKLAEQMKTGYFGFCPTDTWTPNVNLYENDTAYLVCVDLSGVDKEKIDLTVHEQRLKLSGRREVPVMPDELAGPDPAGRNQKIKVHLMEIDHGGFCREVELPNDVHTDAISASYRNGMLWIELPKKEQGARA